MNANSRPQSPIRFVYRIYRNLKNSLQHRKGFATTLFFRMLSVAEVVLSGNVRSKSQLRKNVEWKKSYAERFGTGELFRIQTDHQVATKSIDHIIPRGATHDSSTNPRFNQRVYEFLGRRTGLRMLDLGCAGGGLVRSFLEDGNLAVGVEGSDIPKREQLAEWANCPMHLFTADITHPFMIVDPKGAAQLFDVVTAWEVLEHIPTESLPDLIDNISRHLVEGGHFIASVDQTPDVNPLTGAVYHVTLQGRAWWLQQFASKGLVECTAHPFQVEDYVRGNGLGLKNWDPRDGDGFHLVLKKAL